MTVTDERVIGAQIPTIHVVPEYASTSGHEAALLADRAGLVLDPWQRLVLRDALGELPDGRWAAFEAAVMVARQNGKGSILEARMLAGLFLLNERLIMYSAHEFKTAVEMFRRIEELIAGTSAFSRRVKHVSRTRGEEGIELTTGQRLRFLARSTGSGRGFSGDCNLLDEAQHLGEAPVDALMPTMSARPNPQLWYAGSAPDKDLAPCEPITRVRRRALSGDSRRLAYFEWSATLCNEQCGTSCTEHDSPADPATWAKTNPGLGIRITPEHIATEQESMSPRGFARERLSVGEYPTEGGGWEVISREAWEATAYTGPLDERGCVVDPAAQLQNPIAVAVDVTPDRSMASIAIAGARRDGLVHLELAAHRPGTGWVVPHIVSLIATQSPCAVALDPGGPAGSLVPALTEAGVEVTTPERRHLAAACGALYDAVVRPPGADEGWASQVRHLPHPALTSALAGASQRTLTDAWAWDRRGTSVDISPLVAVTLARWAYMTRPREDQATAVPLVAWR